MKQGVPKEFATTREGRSVCPVSIADIARWRGSVRRGRGKCGLSRSSRDLTIFSTRLVPGQQRDEGVVRCWLRHFECLVCCRDDWVNDADRKVGRGRASTAAGTTTRRISDQPAAGSDLWPPRLSMTTISPGFSMRTKFDIGEETLSADRSVEHVRGGEPTCGAPPMATGFAACC